MTSRWANPVNNNILRDLQNNVLTGGSLEFYEAGTSTPLAVYSDSDLTTSAGSTLTADAYGLIADFFLAAGTEYKMVAKDSGGTTKWTRDDVFSLDSSTDTRLDSLESQLASIQATSANRVLNSSCAVQRVGVSAPTIDSAFQQGTVLGHYVKATNSTAGTITRGTTTAINAAYYVHASGVSTNNSGSTVVAQYRIKAGDVAPFVSSSGVFTGRVYHDVGSAIDYTVTIKKADAENDFSSLTTIGSSSATSVSDATWTLLTYSNSALGDCRNGLVIEVSAACGVQTTKNYYFAEPQFETGTTATAWGSGRAENEEAGLRVSGHSIATDHIGGMLLSLDTDTDHDINVTAGSCRDDSDQFNITHLSEMTKQIDATWAPGDDAGGLASGDGSVAAFTTYYIYAIQKDDGSAADIVIATTEARALLPDGSTAYDYARLIGACWTDTSANIACLINKKLVGTGQEVWDNTTTGTYTGGWDVPSFVSAVDVHIVAGGGSGSGATNNGADSVFDSFTAGGGNYGGAGANSGLSFTASPYVTHFGIGQVPGNANGGEPAFYQHTTAGTISKPNIYGGAGGANAGTRGGGGGGASLGGNGGDSIKLQSYPVSGAITMTVGAGGAGDGSNGAGGDGFIMVRF